MVKRTRKHLNSIIEIESIEHHISLKEHPDVLAYSIETPVAKESNDIQLLNISGWMLGKYQKILSIEVCLNGQVIKLIPLKFNRQDVLSAYPTSNFTKNCGFCVNVGTVGIPERFKIVLRAVMKVGDNDKRKRIIIASIYGIRKLFSQTSFVPKRYPLMLTSMPRSGTTWMMRMLSNIPGVISHSAYPYEMRVGSYWMHALKVLIDPADFSRSTVPDNFESNMESIGHNPYYDPHYYLDRPNMKKVHSLQVLENTAVCCMKNIDAFYDTVEFDEDKKNTQYFLEKQMPSYIQNIYRELYLETKEIVLVRDLRDVICSAMHFNNKRNTKEFGRGLVKTDREWIQNMRDNLFERILITIRNRKKSILLLRYEEIVNKPETLLTKVLHYTNIQLTRQEIEALIKASSSEDKIITNHQTSSNTSNSIGRWKKDLNKETQNICNEILGGALLELGYDL